MNLLEWLSGGRQKKSEAEEYMEKRNKEYAKKCAEYKRQEMRNNNDNYELFGNSNRTEVKRRVTVSRISMDGAKQALNRGLDILKGNLTGNVDVEDFKQITRECANSSLSDEEKQAMLKKRLQEKYGDNVNVTYSSSTHTSVYTNDCNDCAAQDDAFDKNETSLFEIKTVQKSGYVVKLCGKITRGRFGTGEEVVIKTNTGTVKTKIMQMMRQGQEINYANTSSGVIVITIPDNPSAMIQPGDKLTKTNLRSK